MSLVDWHVDNAHSAVLFSVRHMMFAKVHGRFTRWTASLQLDDSDWTRSRVTASIEAASIDTGDMQRDGHLRSPDFLDADKFPKLTFESKKIDKVANDRYRVTGPLNIRGTALDVTLDVEFLGLGKDPWGNDRAAFLGKVAIERKAWGLMWNQALEAGGVLVADRVEIELDLQATGPKKA
jgi:polyisoprenoid-binding protein YceI